MNQIIDGIKGLIIKENACALFIRTVIKSAVTNSSQSLVTQPHQMQHLIQLIVTDTLKRHFSQHSLTSWQSWFELEMRMY